MSDIIQLLPDSVANQIAAGEVIQRPASVIKELVENAIDAGAHRIDIIVVDAGRTSIQVVDDGKGMSETDARLSFERHATSKIRHADDLFNLHTMGFRGEALASIAAVAQVTLKTRMADEEIGTQLTIAGSKFQGQEAVACPVGSNFIIENLFFNVPARRKFLKSNTTELNNILQAFERIALVYPDIAFNFYSNGSEMYNLKAGNLRRRIVDIFGKRINQDLLPVDLETSVCGLHGFVGKPESAKKKGVHQFFFVNGRYMRHPYFHKAVQQAFDRLIPTGDQVPYFLYFDVDPRDIDVNIHPTKTEIKFENEQAIFQILLAAVKDAVGLFSEVSTIEFDTEGRPDIPIFNPDGGPVEVPMPDYNPNYNPFKETPNTESTTTAQPSEGQTITSRLSWNSQDNAPDTFNPFDDSNTPLGSSASLGSLGPSASSAQSRSSVLSASSSHKAPTSWETLYAGLETPAAPRQAEIFEAPAQESLVADKAPTHYQYKGRYIMTAVKSGLMIIDQHRAHVRILFEQYLRRLAERKMHAQKVLFPETIELTARENATLQQVMDEVTALGFELSSLGGQTYAIQAVPESLDGIDAARLLHDMLARAGEKAATAIDEINRALSLSMARAMAIPYGQVLSNDEMEHVVNSLFQTTNVNYTPDGKSILQILKQDDLEKMF